MSTMLCVCTPSESTCCFLDQALAQILQQEAEFDGVDVYFGGLAQQCQQDSETITMPYVVIYVNTIGQSEYLDSGAFVYDVVVRFRIFTDSPDQGSQLSLTILRLLNGSGAISVAGGVACPAQPGLPQLVALPSCKFMTQVNHTFVVQLNLT